MTFATALIAIYLTIGLTICFMLRLEKAPGSWLNYVLMALGWPVILMLAALGRL